jgi:hypothetical protein
MKVILALQLRNAAGEFYRGEIETIESQLAKLTACLRILAIALAWRRPVEGVHMINLSATGVDLLQEMLV